MQIEVMAESPTYGGGGAVAYVGDFLVEGLPPVGTAVDRVEVSLLLTGHPQALRRRPTDEPEESRPPVDPYAADPAWGKRHEAARQKGPALAFRRVAGRIDVRIISELSEHDVFGQEGDPAVFAQAAREVVTSLAPLGRRVKPRDDLDLPRLLAHLDGRLAQLPATAAELAATTDALISSAQARWSAMTPWEVVDVDWSLYAPEARTLLDDPFYWDPADDESPHGNDEGADLLSAYLEQRPADVLAFVAGLEAGDPAEDDDIVIAAAFAELKVTGRMHPTIRDRALQAVVRRDTELVATTSRLLADALR